MSSERNEWKEAFLRELEEVKERVRDLEIQQKSNLTHFKKIEERL
ncbi:MAG: hypothetical protein ACFFDN_00060 [Candidatus Hodarchaeota archaeon]